MLADRLGSDDAFWAHASEAATAPHTIEAAAEKARLYVPRGPKNREVLTALIYTASQNLDTRYDDQGRAGLARVELRQAAGPVAYFPDGPPLEPRVASKYVTSKGARASAPALMRLEDGAEAIARRGAGECLACGSRLASRRERTYAPIDRKSTARVDYCNQCDPDDYQRGKTLAAIQAVLDPAADFLARDWFRRLERPAVEVPEARFSTSVVSQLCWAEGASFPGDHIGEAIGSAIDAGLMAEAA